MNLEQRITLKQTQKLIMTPALQLAIKLLPLARLDLIETIKEELTENPLLEEQSGDDTQQPSDDLPDSQTEKEVIAGESEPEVVNNDDSPDIDWDTYFQNSIDEKGSISDFSESVPLENRLTKGTTLSDHLEWQLDLSSKTEKEKQIGSTIIGNLDSKGYLNSPIEDIAQFCSCTDEDARNVLTLIQSFDPSGVGARDLKECLLIQIQQRGEKSSVAEEIISNYLEYITSMQYEMIAKKLAVPMEKVYNSIKLIQSLAPNPAHRFNSDEIRYIIPDVLVIKSIDDYTIVLNDEGIPRLTINPFYKNILKDKKNTTPEKEYIENKFRSAIWLIRSIEQRRNTIMKVAKSIVNFQRPFLEKGVEALKPLILKDVANDINMHESTVSRVTSNKYMHTPQGLLEFKYFFHSGIESKYGKTMSSVSIKNTIKNIIEKENPEHPITDCSLLSILKEKDIPIARRTITKYRKELKISPAHKRKRRLL